MDNNNYGNRPSFGSTPFNGRDSNRNNPPRTSFGNSSYRPMSSFGSGYPRPSSFGSSYGRPMGGMNRPPYGSFSGAGAGAGSRSFGYSGMGGSGFNRPASAYGGMSRPAYGASPYASRFAPTDASRYGHGRTLPPFSTMPQQPGQPQEPVFNKYSLDNAQPQGVDVNNNFQPTAQVQDAAPQYQEPAAQYEQPAQEVHYDQPAQDVQYDQQYEQPAQEMTPMDSGEELSADFLKNWEPSIMALAEYSSVGSEQRGAYIIDDAGNVICEGFEGKQEDPNNPDAELFEYAAEVNAINSAYSNGRDGELYNANLLVSEIPSEETASYIAQMGLKAIYYWVKGEKEFKKFQKNKDYKKVSAILEPLNCKLIPVQGDKK